jgi:outer membrane protein assembly factor BamB
MQGTKYDALPKHSQQCRNDDDVDPPRRDDNKVVSRHSSAGSEIASLSSKIESPLWRIDLKLRRVELTIFPYNQLYRPGQIRFLVLIVAWAAAWGICGLGHAIGQTSPNTSWPGWLGPQRNGWVDGFQPPAQWPEQLKRGWQVEVGTGYSSPLVTDGLVYQHARQGDDEVVWCIDLLTGEVRWRESGKVPFKAAPGGERHGAGPKSSPVLADGRLFTMSILGDLTAWDVESGRRLWRTDYGSRFQPNRPNWGVATSPIVDGDRVIAHFGGDDEGALVALDVETGAELWTQGSDGPSYSSPLVVEIQGVRQVVEWNHRALVGVDVETGRFLWEFPFPQIGSDQNMPTPVFDRGRVLLGGENRDIHCLEPKTSDGKWSVKEHWYQEEVALNMSTAVVNGEWLFGFSHYNKGQFFCLDTPSGRVLWKGPGRTGDNVMFLSVPGYVVALINDGRLQVIAARGDRFDRVASYRVAEGDTYAPPVLLPSGFLVKDLKTLTFWSL